MSNIKRYINKLMQNENLSREEASCVFEALFELPNSLQAIVLLLLRSNKESYDEIKVLYEVVSHHSAVIKNDYKLLDIVGTGGDNCGTFNISTAASLLVAACGVQVAKHGSSTVSSKSGSFDIIQELGVNCTKNSVINLRNIEKFGYTYLPASLFNTKMSSIGQLRKELGFATIFNIVGPLLNPMQPSYQLLGVYRYDLMRKMFDILKEKRLDGFIVVHSEDGLDEFSLSSDNYVLEYKNGIEREYMLCAEDIGLKRTSLDAIKMLDGETSYEIVQGVLFGDIAGPRRDIVLFNAAMALMIANKVKSPREGLELAMGKINSFEVRQFLHNLCDKR